MSKWQGFDRGRFPGEIDGLKNQRVLLQESPLKLNTPKVVCYKRIV